jgi:outer membrane lipoprotein LolB
LRHVTGWVLPVSGMHYWVRALAVPGVEAQTERNDSGQVARLEQSGWVINYDRYQSVAGVVLPGRLRMERDDISIRLVVDEWQLDVTDIPEA